MISYQFTDYSRQPAVYLDKRNLDCLFTASRDVPDPGRETAAGGEGRHAQSRQHADQSWIHDVSAFHFPGAIEPDSGPPTEPGSFTRTPGLPVRGEFPGEVVARWRLRFHFPATQVSPECYGDLDGILREVAALAAPPRCQRSATQAGVTSNWKGPPACPAPGTSPRRSRTTVWLGWGSGTGRRPGRLRVRSFIKIESVGPDRPIQPFLRFVLAGPPPK